MFSAEFKARQAGTRIVRSPPTAQNVPSAPRTNRRHLRRAVPEENFWHIASGEKGVQLWPFFEFKQENFD